MFLVYLNLSVYRLIAIRKIRWNICTILHPLLDTPFDVPRYGLALLLRQRCHDRRDHLAGHSGCVNALFLEQDAHAKLLEFPDGSKTVFRIAGKARDGLDQNPVDLSLAAVCHHALEVLTLVNRSAGDAGIRVDIDHFPV